MKSQKLLNFNTWHFEVKLFICDPTFDMRDEQARPGYHGFRRIDSRKIKT